MYSTTYLLRLAKIILVFSVALWGLFIVFGNLTDYYTNYHFVEHVLKMDTIFPGSKIAYRSINNVTIFHCCYALIILMETAMTFCCFKGGWLLYKERRKDALAFNAAKNWAVAGLIIGIVLWFAGFKIIGGEWFAMWQSSNWNVTPTIERITIMLVAILILLHLKDE